jgi:16S rRNA (guanine527-N7)-methyltransferase
LTRLAVSEALPTPADLQNDADALGVPLSLLAAERLLKFGHSLLRWNQAFNLVSRQDVHRLYSRHLLDSLSAVARLSGERVLDVGTGPGLPGIPLAIAAANVQFMLVDRNERRIRFVRQVAADLGLGNVEAVSGDVRKVAAGRQFDTITLRAVAPLETAWTLCEPFLGPKGRLVLMASGQTPADRVSDVSLPRGCREIERCLVLIPGLPLEHEIRVVGRA